MKTVKTRSDLLKLLPKGIVIAELGVFIGDFSKEIIRIVEPKVLYMVDIFAPGQCYSGDKDGENDITVPDLSVYFDILKEQFKEYYSVTVLKAKTADFLVWIPNNCLDAVYIDASHRYIDVLADLMGSYLQIDKGFILGHDYDKEEVKRAVDDFCKITKLEIDCLTEDKCPSFMIIK